MLSNCEDLRRINNFTMLHKVLTSPKNDSEYFDDNKLFSTVEDQSDIICDWLMF